MKKLHTGHSNDIRPQPASLDGPTVVNISIKIIQVLDIVSTNYISILIRCFLKLGQFTGDSSHE